MLGGFSDIRSIFPLVHSCLSWSLEPCKNTRKCPLSGVFAADNSHYDVADVILELETGSIVRSMCICSDSDIYESQVKRVSWELWLFQWMLMLSSLSRSFFSGVGTHLSNREVFKLWCLRLKCIKNLMWFWFWFLYLLETF